MPPRSGLTASCPRVCCFPPCNERQASHYVRSCNARLPDWPVSSSAFISFTSSSAVRSLFFNSACTCAASAISTWTRCQNRHATFFKKSSKNDFSTSLQRVFFKLFFQGSLCYLLKRRQIVHHDQPMTGCYLTFSDSSSAFNRLTLSSAWRKHTLWWFAFHLNFLLD